MFDPYPWQLENWKTLQSANNREHLPHALLFSGVKGIGLQHFANCLAAALLCTQPSANGVACEGCRYCHLLHTGNHPDLRILAPEEQGKPVKVEIVRDMLDWLHLKSHYQGYKVAIIVDAEMMNKNATGALLKTLEEPPGEALLLLLTHNPNLLAITIRSRCQHMPFKATYADETLQWLSENTAGLDAPADTLIAAGGAPLLAIQMFENNALQCQLSVLKDLEKLRNGQADPVKIAAQWKDFGASLVLQWLLYLITDMTRLKLSAQPIKTNNVDIIKYLNDLTKYLGLKQLVAFYELLLENYTLSSSIISYNELALLEDSAIYWQMLMKENDEQ